MLTINDVYSIEDMQIIFGKGYPAAIIGSERHRIAKKYGLSMLHVHTKRAFMRYEAKVAAALEDQIQTGKLPLNLDTLPYLCRQFIEENRLPEIIISGYYGCYQRALLRDKEIPKQADVPINELMTVDEVAAMTDFSRETVYAKSDVRAGDWKTIKFAGIHLWIKESIVAASTKSS